MARNKSGQNRWTSQDNKTLLEKSHLRKRLLEKLEAEPCVLETHGGTGEIYLRCYAGVREGAVFETDPVKAVTLLKQRPNWAVYETDCVWGLENGVGGHLEINFVDFDPYGAAWTGITAFFNSQRPQPEQLIIVVHDGIRSSLQRFGGSRIQTFSHIIEEIGEVRLHSEYLSVCERLLVEMTDSAGYEILGFGGFYSKQDENQTHFFAELKKIGSRGECNSLPHSSQSEGIYD